MSRNDGINFLFHDIYYNDVELGKAKVRDLYAKGKRHFRLNILSYTLHSNITFRNAFRTIAEYILSYAPDTTVMWGYSINLTSTINNATLVGDYRNTFVDTTPVELCMAEWAHNMVTAYGRRLIILLGNEMDNKITDLTPDQFITYIRDTLAADFAALAPGVFLGYSSTTTYYPNWKAGGLGSNMYYYCMNVYYQQSINPTSFEDNIRALYRDFGHHGLVTEWQAHDNGRDGFSTDLAYETEFIRRKIILRRYRIRNYVWMFDPGSVNDDKWAMEKTDLSIRPVFTNIVANPRIPLYNTDPYNNPGRNLIPNPNAESGVTNWNTENGATIQSLTPAAVTGYPPAYFRITKGADPFSRVWITPTIRNDYPGKRGVLVLLIRSLAGTTKCTIENSRLDPGIVEVTGITSSWQLIMPMSGIIKSTGSFNLYIYGEKRGTTDTGTIDVKGLFLEAIPKHIKAYPRKYIDGALGVANGYVWAGTANVSESFRQTQAARQPLTL